MSAAKNTFVIVKRKYSHNPWRLESSDGRAVTCTLVNESGQVIATGHPVCGNTRAEVERWALSRLWQYASDAQNGLVSPTPGRIEGATHDH